MTQQFCDNSRILTCLLCCVVIWDLGGRHAVVGAGGCKQNKYCSNPSTAEQEKMKVFNFCRARIEEGTFARCSALRKLYVMNDSISAVDEAAFNGSTLRELIFYKNNFSQIPVLRIPRLVRFQIQGNKLTEVRRDDFKYLRRLTYVSLSSNKIHAVSPKAFCTTRVDRISLRLNKLRCIPDFTCTHKTLKKLYLSSNMLGTCEVDVTYAVTFSALYRLHVSRNQLTQLPRLLLVSPRLRDLDVSYNRLTSLAAVSYLGQQLQILSAGNNPLTCGSESVWLVDTREENKTRLGLPEMCSPSGPNPCRSWVNLTMIQADASTTNTTLRSNRDCTCTANETRLCDVIDEAESPEATRRRKKMRGYNGTGSTLGPLSYHSIVFSFLHTYFCIMMIKL